MAVPSITSVDPSSGLTKGRQLVEIHGSGFRIPPAPPPTGYLGGSAQKTVSVQFGGEESPWAHALSPTRVQARAPEYRGPYDASFPLSLDVRVANLDDSGAEIAGEEDTLSGAYTIARPSLQTEGVLQRVIGEFIRLMRRHVLANTHLSTHPDFDDDPSDALDEVAKAELPRLELGGPDLSENRFYSYNRRPEVDDPDNPPDGYLRRRRAITVDARFDLTGFARSQRVLLGLAQATSLFFRDVRWVQIERDPSDPSLGIANYELAMPFDGQPEIESGPELDSLRSFGAVAIIRGVDVDETDSIVVERGIRLPADPSIDSQEL